MAIPKYKPYSSQQEPSQPVTKPDTEPELPDAEPEPLNGEPNKADGKKRRYEVSLSKKEDPCCYVLAKSFDRLQDAKDNCVILADSNSREAIVFDNKEHEYPIIFRHKPKVENQEAKDGETKKVDTAASSGRKPKYKA